MIILLAIAILQNNISVNIPQQFGSQTILATAFYISGFLYKKLNFKYQNPLALGIFLLLIPAIVAVFFKWGMIGCKGWIVLPYYAVSMIGTIGILNISKVFADKSLIVKPLTYIGDKTLYILTFHFVCFKLISYIYIKINRLPITQLTSFPTIDTPAAYLWIIYTITGVCLSVLIWRILHPKYINFKLYKQLK